MTRCYVYALTGTAVPRMRAAGRTIEPVRIGACYAAVARMKTLPSVSEETLGEQHAIVACLFEHVDAMLPMRFGALVDADELERFVAAHAAELAGALDLVRGREQMTVRVFGPAQAPWAPSGWRPASGTEYLRSRRAAARPLPPAADVVRRAARRFLAAERSAAGEGRVRATLWHLIDRGKSEPYRAAIARAALRVPPTFRIATSGPWPPFAFAPDLAP